MTKIDGGSGQDSNLNPRPKGPSARQQEILDAYFESPNAAAVSRALNTNERHVRRIVKQFAHRLDERRRHRDEERAERASARQARTQDWADATMEALLRRLDELVSSSDEGVALRAIKIELDLALRAPLPTSTVATSVIDRALEAMQSDLVRRIGAAEPAAAAEDMSDVD